FAMAALITGRLSDAWIRITRRWTLAAWIFLTVGLVLGALWSYGVLGWGGYWAWDPVENVALLPWLMATAFLHSVVIQERRGMLKVWNLSLVVGTFALTTFGTFLTRGSILSSVHAFAQSLVGPMYLGFLVVVLVAVGSATAAVLAVAGMRNLGAVGAFALASFVLAANASELWRGVRAFARATGRGFLPAAPEAVARNRRLYGGLTVHMGLAIAA